MTPHKPIEFLNSACNCPLCGAYAEQHWSQAIKKDYNNFSNTTGKLDGWTFSCCSHCKEHTVWLSTKMIYPFSGSAPLPNSDLPDDIKEDFKEARNIVELSPRGAVALLRLAVQKLCKVLGGEGKNINDDIKFLVSKGLPEKMQKALDSVRVIGNNAVHPGKIDLKDDRQTAYKLFGFINIICDILITQPNQIDEFYELEIPRSDKEAIDKRDSK